MNERVRVGSRPCEVSLCYNPQRFYDDELPIKHFLPNDSKATGNARQSRKIELVGQWVKFRKVSYLPAQFPRDVEGELTKLGL